MDQRIAPKEYYSIGEVCSLTGLKPHVLRYWETQFPALRPTKNRAGNRVYRRKEIKLVHLSSTSCTTRSTRSKAPVTNSTSFGKKES